MATRIYRKRFDCPFTTRACGGENCRLWDAYRQTCGIEFDGASLEQLSDNVENIGNALGELTRLFREVVVLAEEEPTTERTRPMQ